MLQQLKRGMLRLSRTAGIGSWPNLKDAQHIWDRPSLVSALPYVNIGWHFQVVISDRWRQCRFDLRLGLLWVDHLNALLVLL